MVDESDTILLKVKNILGERGIDYENVEFIAEIPESKLLKSGDIISPFIGEAVKQLKFSIFERSEGRFVVDNNCGIMRPNPEVLIPDYLQFVLSLSYSTEQILQLLGGGGVPFLGAANAGSIKIPVPPLEIQRELVNELEVARTARREKLAQADALLSGLDGWLLEKLGLQVPKTEKRVAFGVKLRQIKSNRLDAEYLNSDAQGLEAQIAKTSNPVKRLGDLCLQMSGGATPHRKDETQYAEEGVKFLRIQNIAEEGLSLDDVKFITIKTHEELLNRSQLQADDVLMTITGRIGTAAVVRQEHLPANINQHIVLLRLDQNQVVPDFLTVFLNSNVGKQLTLRGVTGTTRLALDYGAVRQLPIVLPDKDIQESIAAEVRTRRERARGLRANAERDWEAAKARFEARLLGGDGEPRASATG